MRKALAILSGINGFGLLLVPSAAQAALAISQGKTNNVTCASGVCSATAKKAVLNVSDLTAMLASGDVKVVPGKKAMDIEIAAPLSWADTSRLTLDGYRSIAVDQPVTVTGTGALTIVTNDGGSRGTFLTGANGYVKFWDTNSNVVINGNTYVLKATLGDIASAIAGNPSGNFALAASYDAKHDGTYSTAPIAYFGGHFEGFGNTIDRLKIKGPSDGLTGLFGGSTGSIENLGAVDAYVSGGDASDIGILAGHIYSGGSAFNVWSSGSVTGGDSTASTIAHIGGLLGGLYDGSTLANSHSSAKVVAGGSTYAGGLVGDVGSSSSPTTSVVNSYATGNVTAGDNILGQYQGSQVGGLAGAAGSISGAELFQEDYATGAVKAGGGSGYSGGLVGNAYGSVTISLSHASGAVAVGAGSSTNGGSLAGGLVAQLFPSNTASPAVNQSYATGAVSGSDGPFLIGGLYGYSNAGQVADSYATGAVSANSGGSSSIGGFGGDLDTQATVSTSYSIGSVQQVADAAAGGFTGYDTGSQSNDYWDTDTSGLSSGCGYPQDCSGVKGLTTKQLQSKLPKRFSDKIWALDPKKNGGFPYLIANPPAK